MKHLSDKKPIFIVGMNGSGTTLLLDCLNNHPNLCGFIRETHILPRYIASVSKYGDLDNDNNFLKLFNDFRNEFVFRTKNDGHPIPLPDAWRDLHHNISTVIDSIFMYFANREGKKRWCEKTPIHALHISTLNQIFPNAKFIHIIRDGRDCAASLHRRYSYTPEVVIYRWKKMVREARRQGSFIGDQYYEVYYEELTTEPRQWMRNICSFLDEPYVENILEASRFRKGRTPTSTTMIVPNTEKWRQYFNDRKLIRLEEIAGRQLDELGYPTSLPAFDRNPSTWFLRFHNYHDYFKSRTRSFIKYRKNLRREIQFSFDKFRSRFTF